MTRSDSMPTWLKVILAVIALAVFGPFALALFGVLLGLSVAVAAVAIKVAVVVLAIGLVVSLFRAIFGSSRSTPRIAPAPEPSIEDLAARMEREERARREALDRELHAAMNHAP